MATRPSMADMLQWLADIDTHFAYMYPLFLILSTRISSYLYIKMQSTSFFFPGAKPDFSKWGAARGGGLLGLKMGALHRPLYKVSFFIWGEWAFDGEGAQVPQPPSGYAPAFFLGSLLCTYIGYRGYLYLPLSFTNDFWSSKMVP